MDIFSIVIFCFIWDVSISQGESEFLHTVIEDGGKIEPYFNFNGLYTKNQKRKWSLAADEGVWGLVFKKFLLERSDNCRHDYLQIEEIVNSTIDAPIPPIRYCGEKLPGPYVSSSPRVDIRFVSDILFEHEGFLIHVMHSKDEVALRQRVFSMSVNEDSSKFEARKDENKPPVSSDQSLLYILAGCSLAGLVLFGVLLTYFVFSIRKRETNPPSRLPEPYYIQATSLDLKSHQPGVVNLPEKDTFVCKIGKSGKRYRKDIEGKDNNNKTCVTQAHHNNLYVSETLTNNEKSLP